MAKRGAVALLLDPFSPGSISASPERERETERQTDRNKNREIDRLGITIGEKSCRFLAT